ncbi:alpha/beta fold hydrolase [Yimella sp. cx-51]|uniref:alpha/beta fold hydrolase n=1 Tax=Yimella sp. cx-51 TaxID=2770551 RepID=UPI00165E0F52|nr:alpha/beta fold hydrolase [Yimella sp. cx-51]MBC9956583.1 hypothetical protein [Yimella sp. cx-51]QTH38316.1 hypothetical protein J5M86_01075 [Yimella sp. cx-51]
MSGEPERTGGSHSTVADLADMHSTAGVLDRAGNDVRGAGGRLITALLRLPATAVPLAPLRAADIAADEFRLVHGLQGLAATGLDLEVIARSLRFSASAYAGADATADALMRSVQVAIALPRMTAALCSAAAWSAAATVPLPSQYDWARDAAMPERIRDKSPDQAFVAHLKHRLIASPGLTEDALITVRLLAGDSLAEVMAPGTLERRAAGTTATARVLRLLRDDHPLTVRTAPPIPHSQRPPRDVGDVFDSVGSIESEKASAGNTASRIRVRHVTSASGEGAWIVEVPGTQDWSATQPSNPSDAAANLAAVAGLPSTLYPAIEKALQTSMAKAGVKPGSEPVMLAGHSQGGIVATRLAQDRRFRTTFRVTHVATAGSPVSHIRVPASVQTLDLAHKADPVPRLDHQKPPDVRHRYGITGDPVARPEDKTDPIAVHGADRYAESARIWAPAHSTDPDVRAFYDSAFFGGDTGTVDDYHLQRKPPDVVAKVPNR